ncbi:MAG TPA: GNAT family N-acetyltransferase [Epulopiscium sp.]|nr:GNAT family N-acetyltransferase [Candidatus Epulonipiscium sp.]
MTADLLVKLYDLEDNIKGLEKLDEHNIKIVRALALDKSRIIDFIVREFEIGWANEFEQALFNDPTSCFIAIKDKEVIGFACYNATGKGFFGPTGVSNIARGKGVGTVLLLKCLLDMREMGYGYAIIGGASDAIAFYSKIVGATVIPDSHPGIYSRMIAGGFEK